MHDDLKSQNFSTDDFKLQVVVYPSAKDTWDYDVSIQTLLEGLWEYQIVGFKLKIQQSVYGI